LDNIEKIEKHIKKNNGDTVTKRKLKTIPLEEY